MDPLSDVLRAVRLSGAYFYMVEASKPWSVFAVAAREMAPRVLPDAEHLISYHVLVSGTCWGGVAGQSRVLMQPGDVIMFPQGDAHFLSSEEGTSAGTEPDKAAPRRYPSTVQIGPHEPRDTTFVCGFLGCDTRPYNPLISSLPHCIHLSGAMGGWLSEFPRQVVSECRAGRAGSDTMLTRMAELMFVEVLRRHVEASSPQARGWLSGLVDPVVGPALKVMHERPAHPWTLAELAQEIATSRTVLAEKFSNLVGIPPMQYLTQWRLQLAAEQLIHSSSKVAAIAEHVGYDSEASFSRAFKRVTGQSPAEWRRSRHKR